MASNFHSLQISTASLQRKRKNRNWKNFVKKGFQSSSSPSESNHFYRLSLSPFDGRTFARILKRIIGIIGKKKRQDSTRDFWHLFLYPSSLLYLAIFHQSILRFVESDWVLAHQWAEKAGLDVIACVSPDDRRRRTIEGDEDALEIIPFSDHMGFNANWQLGYGKLIWRKDLQSFFASSSIFLFFPSFYRTPN